MKHFLNLPGRTEKPRQTGWTCLIDNGVPTRYFQDVIESNTELVDSVKFGWGTCIVTQDLYRKIEILQANEIDYFLGGTFFEKALTQRKLNEFHKFYRSLGCTYMEISNGTIDISHEEKADYILAFANEFRVLSEVGFKDSQRSLEMAPNVWINCIKTDLEAGAHKVILEARESGQSGICRSDGEVRFGLISEVLQTIDEQDIIFEAPTKQTQTFFIKRVGPNVNLGNIAFTDVIGLETLRLGLRSDTLLEFEKAEYAEEDGLFRAAVAHA